VGSRMVARCNFRPSVSRLYAGVPDHVGLLGLVLEHSLIAGLPLPSSALLSNAISSLRYAKRGRWLP